MKYKLEGCLLSFSLLNLLSLEAIYAIGILLKEKVKVQFAVSPRGKDFFNPHSVMFGDCIILRYQ